MPRQRTALSNLVWPRSSCTARRFLVRRQINDALHFLMEARGLKQENLSAIVPQTNLSAILAGKRKISATMAGKLGKFFGVSPAVFVPTWLNSPEAVGHDLRLRAPCCQ